MMGSGVLETDLIADHNINLPATLFKAMKAQHIDNFLSGILHMGRGDSYADGPSVYGAEARARAKFLFSGQEPQLPTVSGHPIFDPSEGSAMHRSSHGLLYCRRTTEAWYAFCCATTEAGAASLCNSRTGYDTIVLIRDAHQFLQRLANAIQIEGAHFARGLELFHMPCTYDKALKSNGVLAANAPYFQKPPTFNEQSEYRFVAVAYEGPSEKNDFAPRRLCLRFECGMSDIAERLRSV